MIKIISLCISLNIFFGSEDKESNKRMKQKYKISENKNI